MQGRIIIRPCTDTGGNMVNGELSMAYETKALLIAIAEYAAEIGAKKNVQIHCQNRKFGRGCIGVVRGRNRRIGSGRKGITSTLSPANGDTVAM